MAIYSWGYGCVTGSSPTFVPKATFAFTPTCNTMQVPGPTMVVTEGQTVTINLTNNLPTAAGNTSILFPGFNVTTSCTAATPAGQQGLLTCEAAPGSHGDLHVHRLSAGHARVLQRNAGRPPGRDGALRRHHCVAGDSARQLRQRHDHNQPVRKDGLRDSDQHRWISRAGLPPVYRSLRPPQELLRPGIPVSVGRDGFQNSQTGRGAGSGQDGLHGGDHGMQSRRTDRTLPSGLLPDQRALHA